MEKLLVSHPWNVDHRSGSGCQCGGGTALTVFLRPGLGKRADRLPWRERLEAFRKTWLIGGLFLLVLGGIYWGFFTPTEAGAVGAAGAFILMAMRGKADFKNITEALSEAVLTTAAILVTMSASLVFNNFLTITGLTGQLIEWVQSYAAVPLLVILAICAIYIVLGAVFDSLAAMILTVPVLTPLVASLGYDPIWFGILVVVAVELGLITPPMGMNVFIVQRQTPGVSVWTLFRGVTPFVIANLILMGLLIALPWLALV
ncbi:TRAP transporter large permease subunit [Martelella mediterranea]|uniref:TRAP transporter large permease subunit n=1 Tax=Martelella mediterranea TaxID=293089 RepID=UPI001E3594EB|nr:TRAP transporter large permease subunit [Martelella mediterranea]MCD1636531.1 TRAP transporter large permease subunit [Martelella mediterranea]